MVQLLIMDKTNQQFDHIIGICRDVFVKKMKDYGTAWRILRPKSMTDQIYIKAQRIRSIEEKGISKIEEDARDEFIGIINYCAMALIQLELGPSEDCLLYTSDAADEEDSVDLGGRRIIKKKKKKEKY